MRRLGISGLIAQIAIGLTNLVLGMLNLLHHRPAGTFQIVAAIIVFSCAVSTYRLVRSIPAMPFRERYEPLPRELHDIAMREMYRVQVFMGGVRHTPSAAAYEYAFENLNKVLRALHGKVERHNALDPDRTIISIGQFTISSGHIFIFNKDSGVSTCYVIMADMPCYEKMACAALLLHNNPTLFDYWRCQPGEFKA